MLQGTAGTQGVNNLGRCLPGAHFSIPGESPWDPEARAPSPPFLPRCYPTATHYRAEGPIRNSVRLEGLRLDGLYPGGPCLVVAADEGTSKHV